MNQSCFENVFFSIVVIRNHQTPQMEHHDYIYRHESTTKGLMCNMKIKKTSLVKPKHHPILINLANKKQTTLIKQKTLLTTRPSNAVCNQQLSNHQFNTTNHQWGVRKQLDIEFIQELARKFKRSQQGRLRRVLCVSQKLSSSENTKHLGRKTPTTSATKKEAQQTEKSWKG